MPLELEIEDFGAALDDWVENVVEGEHYEAVQEMPEVLADMFDEIFTSQIDSTGTQWPEHAPATIARHGAHPLLILTSDLYQSLTGNGPSHVEYQDGYEMVWGTNAIYANTQNFGDPTRNIPAREYMYFTATGIENIEDVIMDHIELRVIPKF